MIRGIEAVEGVGFEVYDTAPGADEFFSINFEGAHAELVTTFSQAFGRSVEEVESLVGDIHDFTRVRVDPDVLTREGRVPLQKFARPLLALAYNDRSKVVGMAFSADAISGETEAVRNKKALILPKRYRWLKEIAVDPDHQGRGVGKVLAMLSFRQAFPLQPASAYTFPDESDAGARFLEGIGMHVKTDEERSDVKAFGEETDGVRQVKYAHQSARGLAKEIKASLDDTPELQALWRTSSAVGKFIGSLLRYQDAHHPPLK